MLGAGEMIGEECLFKEQPLSYNVITESECDFYVLDISKFQNLCGENKYIKEIMLKKVEAKKEMIKRRMKPYEQIMKSGNEGGLWKHDKLQNNETKINELIKDQANNKNLKIRGFDPDRKGQKKYEQMHKNFDFKGMTEFKKQKAEMLPKLDQILSNSNDKKKPQAFPLSINNIINDDNEVIKSQICF